MKIALIFGITGQDGSYLAALLLTRGYKVMGVTRSKDNIRWCQNLDTLNISNQVNVIVCKNFTLINITDIISKVIPQEIYNLAGESSVKESFDHPAISYQSITILPALILQSIRDLNPAIKFYNAGSGEMFGGNDGQASKIDDSHAPKSPYALAKSASFRLVKYFRDVYGLYAVTGVLYNHESPLRGKNFVTQRVVFGAKAIAQGRADSLSIGNLGIERDWGWAPDYVEAMFKMLQLATAEDFVVCTGIPNTLERFVELTFRHYGLDWKSHIKLDKCLKRPLDIQKSLGNPEQVKIKLNWAPSVSFEEIIMRMCDSSI